LINTDSVKQYLSEIGRYPLLSASEEVRLGTEVRQWLDGSPGATPDEVTRIEQAGRRARERMIVSNLRLVVSVAKKYLNRGLDFQDLLQEGAAGLAIGVEKFDPQRGYKLSTYVYWWIRQSLTRAITVQSRNIRLPVHLTDQLNAIKRATRELATTLGRQPNVDEIAEHLGQPVEKIQDALMFNFRANTASLDSPVGDEDSSLLGDLIPDAGLSPLEAAELDGRQAQVEQFLSTLGSERDRAIMRQHYGLTEGPTSLSAIGQTHGISRERVRQILYKSVRQLKRTAALAV